MTNPIDEPNTDVKQDFITIDWILGDSTKSANNEIKWKMMKQLDDWSWMNRLQMQRKTDKLLETIKSVGLNISKKKHFREEVILKTTTQTSFKMVRISKSQ